MFDICSSSPKSQMKKNFFRKILNNMKGKNQHVSIVYKNYGYNILQWKTTIKDIFQNYKGKFIYKYVQWYLYV